MRKIFAGAMVFSVIGAVILGGTLAWNNTFHIGPQNANVGSLAFSATFDPAPSGNIGPNDGAYRLVGDINVTNSGDYNLRIDTASDLNPGGSRVLILNVDQGHASCSTQNFAGKVVLTGQGSDGAGQVPAPPSSQSTIPDIAQVYMAVATQAPNTCMGAAVSYDILVVGVTAGSGNTLPTP